MFKRAGEGTRLAEAQQACGFRDGQLLREKLLDRQVAADLIFYVRVRTPFGFELAPQRLRADIKPLGQRFK